MNFLFRRNRIDFMGEIGGRVNWKWRIRWEGNGMQGETAKLKGHLKGGMDIYCTTIFLKDMCVILIKFPNCMAGVPFLVTQGSFSCGIGSHPN